MLQQSTIQTSKTKAMSHEQSLREKAKYSGDPWSAGNSYFKRAEEGFDSLWSGKIWPFICKADFTSTVDLAAGHGRNSAKLLPLTASLCIVDINSDNIEACKKRFASVDGHEKLHTLPTMDTTYAISNRLQSRLFIHLMRWSILKKRLLPVILRTYVAS